MPPLRGGGGMMRPCHRAGVLVALVVLVVDQLTKAWMMVRLLDPRVQIPVTDFFTLTPVWNHGVSFGLLRAGAQVQVFLLIALTGAIAMVVAWWLVRAQHLRPALAYGAIIGGAIGNLIDRVRFGAVFDFLDFHVRGHHWPAFNVADSCIVLGVAVLVLWPVQQR